MAQAKAEWRAVDPAADFSGFSATVGDLPGLTLGSEGPGSVIVDTTAAGWGWGSGPGHMSLLTVVRHELGHALGLGHTSGLMAPTLQPGQVWGVDASQLPKPPTATPTATTTPAAPAPAITTTTTTPEEPAAATTTTATTAAPTPTATTAPPAPAPVTSTTTTTATQTPTAATTPAAPAPTTTTSDTTAPSTPTTPATPTDPTAPAATPTTTTTTPATTTSTTAAATPAATTGSTTPAPTPVATGSLAWTVAGDAITLSAGAGTLNGTVTYDAASSSVRYSGVGGTAVSPLGSAHRVVILGSAGNDVVTVNPAGAPSGVTFAFDGGAGANTIGGPSADTQWSVTGPDSGSFGRVSFTRAGHVVGAAGNRDTFTLQPGGSLTGLLDGGAGGFDSLVIAGQRGAIGSTAIDHSSGTISLDGTTLRYTGLEPVTASGSVIHVNGTSGDDNLIVGVTGTTISVTGSTMESFDFSGTGLTQLFIDGGAGTDTVSFGSSLLIPGLILDVTAETINVGTSTINTQGGAGNGSISFHAVASDDGTSSSGTITATPGAHIVLTGATLQSGDITLNAAASSAPSSTGAVNIVAVTSTATVSLTNSRIVSSGDVLVASTSTVTAAAAASPSTPGSDPAVDAAFSKLDVTSNALTNLSGTTSFQVAGKLSVSATNTTDLTTNGNALLAGVGAGIALVTLNEATKAYIDANSTGNTAGTVSVTADATNTVTTTSTASGGGGHGELRRDRRRAHSSAVPRRGDHRPQPPGRGRGTVRRQHHDRHCGVCRAAHRIVRTHHRRHRRRPGPRCWGHHGHDHCGRARGPADRDRYRRCCCARHRQGRDQRLRRRQHRPADRRRDDRGAGVCTDL